MTRTKRWPAISVALVALGACSDGGSGTAGEEPPATTGTTEPATVTTTTEPTTTTSTTSTTTTSTTTTSSTTTIGPITTDAAATTTAATTTVSPTTTDTGTTTPPTTASAAGPTDDPGPAADVPDAAVIAAAFARITTSLEVPPGGEVFLPDCPLDPDDTIVPDLFTAFDLGDDGAVADLPVAAGAFDVGEDYGTMIYCDRFPDDGSDGFGVFALATPDDLQGYTSAFADPAGTGGIVIEVTPRDEVAGGALDRICVTAPDAPESDYCEIDWTSGEVLVGAYVNGAFARSVDLDAFEAAFVARIAALATALVAA